MRAVIGPRSPANAPSGRGLRGFPGSLHVRWGALLGLLVACGDPAARVQLVPVPLPNDCGKPPAKTALRVIAYTTSGEIRRTVPPTEIDAFPADTEQLGVEVIGAQGGLASIGKTGPLEFASLANGTSIPIVMAPPDGFCAVNSMTEPRTAPLVARAGAGVLIVGGIGPAGERLSSAEYYDPTTASFTAVAVPSSLIDPDNGLAGAVLAELGDGRVVVTGTASHAFALFDATERKLTAPSLFDHRAFHGAVALDADHLLVIGGCADVSAGTCSGPTLRTGFSYDLRDLTQRERGPALPDTAIRYGAQIFDLGIQADGAHRYLLGGGFGEPGKADRFAVTDSITQTISGLHAQLAALDGGAILSAFEPDGVTQTGPAGVLAPGSVGVAPIALAPKLDGARLALLEDGSVIAIGGGAVVRYVPTTNTWATIMPAGDPPIGLAAPSLVRLDDGSLLVLGGRDPTAQAWIYRPSLVGPQTGSIVALPDASTGGLLTPSDPATVDRTDGFVLTSSDDDLRARVLVGGPRMADGAITAAVVVNAGGVALIGRQTGPGRAIIGRLVPGEPARVQELTGGAIQILCSGTMVSAAELAAPVGLAINDGVATLTVGAPGSATVKATCAVSGSERGAWGIAAAGAGAQIDVGPVTVERTR